MVYVVRLAATVHHRLAIPPSRNLMVEQLCASSAFGWNHRLKSWLGRHMRTTRLTDMLIEVDNDIRFTDHFLPPA
jgi:hypothetical protein